MESGVFTAISQSAKTVLRNTGLPCFCALQQSVDVWSCLPQSVPLMESRNEILLEVFITLYATTENCPKCKLCCSVVALNLVNSCNDRT